MPNPSVSNQNARVLRLLKQLRRGITARDAIEIGVYRLAARIYDLRVLGVPIITETVTQDGARFARYSIHE